MMMTKKALKIASKMITCASEDKMRYQIQCVKIEATKDGLTRMVATDGHKMAIRYVKDATNVTRDLFFSKVDAEKPLKALLKEAKRLDDVAELQGTEEGRQVRFEFGAAIVKAETDQNIPNYPDVDQVLPKAKAGIEVTLNAEYIIQLAEALQDNPSHKGLTFRFYDENSPVMVRADGLGTDRMAGDIGVIMPMRAATRWPAPIRRAFQALEKALNDPERTETDMTISQDEREEVSA